MKSYHEISYELTEQEILSGMRGSGLYKTSGKRAMIESVILIVLCGFFLFSYITRRQGFDLAMTILSLCIVVALNLVPYLDMKRQAKKGLKSLRLRIYPGKVYVYGGEETTPLELSGKTRVVHQPKVNLVTVLPGSGGALIIPLRAVKSDEREAVLQALLANEENE